MSESNIKVAVKMRPLIRREIDKKVPIYWRCEGNELMDTEKNYDKFLFDLVFDEESSTTEVFDKVARPIISNAINGMNGTIIAYGQTSSGKTHTMMGSDETDGLVLMTIKHIFQEVQKSNTEFVLRVGFIEIYNEKIFDLYDTENVDLKIIEQNNDVQVNFKESICKSVEDMYSVMLLGNKNKKIGETAMNGRSSRSHTIFHITIESIESSSEKVKISSLNLVDLAGSERAAQTNSKGSRFVEGAYINKSLLSLSLVINKLINSESSHINYRDSKLTRYLQTSLGGNALAAIICTITPAALEETASTLYFAQRAMKVTNKPRVNEIVSDATMIKQLHNQIQCLTQQLEVEKAKNDTNSAVPRLQKELSYHQGNILNYKSVETKRKLRRQTWGTFDNGLDVISDTKLLHNMKPSSVTNLNQFYTPNPNITRRMTPTETISSPKRDALDIEFEYKAKYDILLFEYEELQEFTHLENEYGVRTEVHEVQLQQIKALESEQAVLKTLCSKLEQENASQDFVFEQYRKKAESREQDLIGVVEELKRAADGDEKDSLISSLTEQLNAMMSKNELLNQKLSEYENIEDRLSKLSSIENEVEELKNTIMHLTMNISILEKKEMSTRFNDSLSMMAVEPATATNVNLQTEYNELSLKLTNLQQENENYKCRIEEMESKSDDYIKEILEDRSRLQIEAEELIEQLNAKVLDFDKQTEHLERLQKELDAKKSENGISHFQSSNRDSEEEMLENGWHSKRDGLFEENVRLLEENGDIQEEHKTCFVDMKNGEDRLNQLIDIDKEHIQVTARKAELETELVEQSENLQRKSHELEKMMNELEDKINENVHLSKQVGSLIIDRDRLQEMLSVIEGKLEEKSNQNDQLNVDLENNLQQIRLLLDEKASMQAIVDEYAQLEHEHKLMVTELDLKMQELMEMEQIRIDLASHQVQLQAAVEDKSQLESKLEILARQFEEYKTEKESAETALRMDCETKSNEVIAELTEKLTNLESVCEIKEEQKKLINDLEEKVISLERLKNEKESTELELNEKFNTMQCQLNSIQTEITVKESTIESLTSVVAELNAKLSEYKGNEQNVQSEIEKSKLDYEEKLQVQQKHFEELKSQLESAATELNEKSKWFELQKIELQNQCEEKIRLVRNEQNGLQNDHRNSVTPDLAGLLEEKENLTGQLEAQLQRAHVLAREKKTLECTVAELESILQEREESDSDTQKLQVELENKKQRIEELEKIVEVNSVSASEILDLKTCKQLIESNLESQLEKVHTLNKEKMELKYQLETLNEDLSEKHNQISSLNKKIEESQKENRSLGSALVEQQMQSTALERIISDKQSIIDKKTEEIRTLVAQLQSLEKSFDAANNELEVTTAALKDKTEELEKHNNNETLLDNLRRDNQQLSSDLLSLQSAKNDLEKRLLAVSEKLNVAQTEIDQSNEVLQEARTEAESLRKQLLSAKAQPPVTDTAEKLDQLREKHVIIQNRVAELESQLESRIKIIADLNLNIATLENNLDSHRGSATRSMEYDEEITRLNFVIRKLKQEAGSAQNKERRERRSSTFDNNRGLFGGTDTTEMGTMTDFTSELCNCSTLNEKLEKMRKENVFKDLQITELKAAEKRSPMLLENYSLKKMVQDLKRKHDSAVEELASTQQKMYQAVKAASYCKRCYTNGKKTYMAQETQTVADPVKTELMETQKLLKELTAKYEEAKGTCKLLSDKSAELESMISNTKENNSSEGNKADCDQKDITDVKELQRKYKFMKKCMQSRYDTIIKLEKEVDTLRKSPACNHCRK